MTKSVFDEMGKTWRWSVETKLKDVGMTLGEAKYLAKDRLA